MCEFTEIPNLNRLFSELWKENGQQVILKYMDGDCVQTLTAGGFLEQVERMAAIMAQRNLCGCHIAVMGANRVQWLAAFCAVCKVGGVAVLLSPDLNSRELAQRMEWADVACVCYDRSLEAVVEEALGEGNVTALCLDQLPDVVIPCEETHGREPGRENPACMLFTSGTTARAKAVMLSHGAMIAGVCHRVIGKSFDAQLAILPLHHIAGIASVLNTWYLGAVVCLGQEMKHLYRYLAGMQPDYMLAVPSIIQVLMKKLKNAGPNGVELGWNLQLLGCGGARFLPDAIRFFHERNIRLLQSYGATEAGGLGFDWEMTEECRDTIGKPCEEIETKILDGELWLKSPSVMMGYYKDPEATAQVLQNGWYATGDLCRQDEDGYLYLTGRKKNVIILANGENVSPEEIESVLQQCPGVEEIMVGLEENLICAAIYGMEEAHQQIREFVQDYNRSVPYYKQVQKLRFLEKPFAKTEIGKTIRRSVLGVKDNDKGTIEC